MTNGVLVDVAEQFAAEAAACWHFREAAVRSPAYDLTELGDLDDRLECHIEGLRLAGDLGWELCAAALEDGDGGEVFAASVIALGRQDWRGFARVLDVAALDPMLARAVVSALGWSDVDRIAIALQALLAKRTPPALRFLGIAGHAIHRRDPGAALEQAAALPDTRLRARVLRAIGELGRADLRHILSANLAHEDEGCRFWAGWSAALCGDHHATTALRELAEAGGSFAERAADTAVRRMDHASARAWLETLAGQGKAATRAALTGAGALGDPALMPLLIAHLRASETARPAAWSISLIANANVSGELGGEPPPDFESGPNDDPVDSDVAMDPDDDLPWPDAARVELWWLERQGQMQAGTRYLFGQPMRPEWLAQVLRKGNQAARAAAAVELCLRSPGRPTFEVRAPGFVQLESLANGAH